MGRFFLSPGCFVRRCHLLSTHRSEIAQASIASDERVRLETDEDCCTRAGSRISNYGQMLCAVPQCPGNRGRKPTLGSSRPAEAAIGNPPTLFWGIPFPFLRKRRNAGGTGTTVSGAISRLSSDCFFSGGQDPPFTLILSGH